MVMEVGVDLLGTPSPSTAPAAPNSSVIPLLRWLLLVMVLMLFF